jgi:hypothetical protein
MFNEAESKKSMGKRANRVSKPLEVGTLPQLYLQFSIQAYLYKNVELKRIARLNRKAQMLSRS